MESMMTKPTRWGAVLSRPHPNSFIEAHLASPTLSSQVELQSNFGISTSENYDRMRSTHILGMRATRPLMRPVPKEEQAAHTISQRLRTLKRIPAELVPLGVVIAAALGAAVYSAGRKLYTDKQLRLTRQGSKR